MIFPPTPELLRAIVAAVRVEASRRPTYWLGGTVFSGIPGYYADVDPGGHFKKIFYKDGEQKEYFGVEGEGR